MDRPDRRSPPLPLWALSICFMGSGLTALIYEILWLRRLQLVFGSTTYSVTTILAAFMAGMGLGSYIVGRRVDARDGSGLRTYGWLEVGVACYALLSLPLLGLAELGYGWLQRHLELGQGGAALLKFLLAFPLLALPAGMMGGTLPALARALVNSRASLHRDVGRLYGINTIGAGLGTVIAGVVLIESLGLWRSMVVTALVNASIGGLVLLALRRRARRARLASGAEERRAVPTVERERGEVGLRAHLRDPRVLFCAVAVTMTGMLSMSYEVVWTRLLTLIVGSSTYAFTIVLTIFLFGIAGGALAYATLSRRRRPSVPALALLLLGLAAWAAVSMAMMPWMPELLVRVARVGLDHALAVEALFAALLLIVPTLLLGAAFPMAMGIVSRAIGQVGRDVGGVCLANTIGAIGGSMLTGFLLIPRWGTQATLSLGLSLNLVLVAIGLGAFCRGRARRLAGVLAAACVACWGLALPSWPAIVYDAGLGGRLARLVRTDASALRGQLHRRPSRVLLQREGVSATVSVRQYPDGPRLLLDGRTAISSGRGLAAQVVLGAVPLLAHSRPREVAIIGWGAGVTAHTATLFPGVARITAIEREPMVLAASGYFRQLNGDAVHDPKVRTVVDDPRSQLLTSERRFDVIVSQAADPAADAALFSREYFALVRKRLRPGGLLAHALSLARDDVDTVAAVARTVASVFPRVQLWLAGPGDAILLAGDVPPIFSYRRVARTYRLAPRLARRMRDFGPGAAVDHLFGCFLLDSGALARFAARRRAPPLTDDRPALEYRARRMRRATSGQVVARLLRLKQRSGRVAPRTRGRRPAPDRVWAGTARLLRDARGLHRQVTRWVSRRYPQLVACCDRTTAAAAQSF